VISIAKYLPTNCLVASLSLPLTFLFFTSASLFALHMSHSINLPPPLLTHAQTNSYRGLHSSAHIHTFFLRFPCFHTSFFFFFYCAGTP
jgi:hypothetical protein